jgi:hypothetical protein
LGREKQGAQSLTTPSGREPLVQSRKRTAVAHRETGWRARTISKATQKTAIRQQETGTSLPIKDRVKKAPSTV